MDTILTTGELGLLFNVSAQTIINWTKSGEISGSRIGNGPRRYATVDVLDFIKRKQIPVSHLDQYMASRIGLVPAPEMSEADDDRK